MEKDIFIGVDGGATKSRIRIEDGQGRLLGQSEGGPANIRLSVDNAWKSIYQAVEEALQSHNISLQDKHYRFHAGMGLAGCEVEEAYNEYLKRPHPFTTMLLTSDARVACVGAHGNQDGSIIIAGTGVVGYQMQEGRGTKVGGWGFPHDDEGGGAWLGLEATRLTFQWIDKRIEESPLLKEIFAHFNNNLNKFVSFANGATATEFAQFAPLVIQYSEENEWRAVHLMKQAAQAINLVGRALERCHVKSNPHEKSLPCCLVGSIAPFMQPWLEETLRARLVPQQGDANSGAILMVKKIMEAQ